jgi:hypothetical protein
MSASGGGAGMSPEALDQMNQATQAKPEPIM